MSHPIDENVAATKQALLDMLDQLKCINCSELPKDEIWMPEDCNDKYCQNCIEKLTGDKCIGCQKTSNPSERKCDLFSTRLLAELLLFEKELNDDLPASISSECENREDKEEEKIHTDEVIKVQENQIDLSDELLPVLSSPPVQEPSKNTNVDEKKEKPTFVVPEAKMPKRPSTRSTPSPSLIPVQEPKSTKIKKKIIRATPPTIAGLFTDDSEEENEEDEEDSDGPPPLLTQHDPLKNKSAPSTPTSSSKKVQEAVSPDCVREKPILVPQVVKSSQPRDRLSQNKIADKKKDGNDKAAMDEIQITGEISKVLRSSKRVLSITTEKSTTIDTTEANDEKTVVKVERMVSTTKSSVDFKNDNNLDVAPLKEENDESTSNEELKSKSTKSKKFFKSRGEKPIAMNKESDKGKKSDKVQNFFFDATHKTRKSKAVANKPTSALASSSSKVKSDDENMKIPTVQPSKMKLIRDKVNKVKSALKNKKKENKSDFTESSESELEKESKRNLSKAKRLNDATSSQKIKSNVANEKLETASQKIVANNVAAKIKKENVDIMTSSTQPTRRRKNSTSSPLTCTSPSPLNSPKILEKKNAKGETKLLVAARLGQLEKVQQLIEAGCDVNEQDFAGWAPIHEAINGKGSASSKLDMVKLLVGSACNVNVLGMNNETPLHSASKLGLTEIVSHLLTHNAAFGFRTIDGKLPRDLATSDETIKLFDEHDRNMGQEPHTVQSNKELSVELKIELETALYFFDCELSNELYDKCKQLFQMNISKELKKEVRVVIFDAKPGENVELSLNYLLAILHGAWILSLQWLEDSLEANKFLNPTPYTITGCQYKEIPDSSKNANEKARTNRELGHPGLFHGMNFYIYKNTGWSWKSASSDSQSAMLTLSKKEIGRLVQAGDGKVINRDPNPDTLDPMEFPVRFHATRPDHKDHKLLITSHIVLYDENNVPPTKHVFEHCKTLKIDWLIQSCICFCLLEPDSSHL